MDDRDTADNDATCGHCGRPVRRVNGMRSRYWVHDDTGQIIAHEPQTHSANDHGIAPAGPVPDAEKAAPRPRFATVKEGTASVDMADVAPGPPCPEEAELLHAFWNLYWNGPGSCDYGDHAGYTWAEMQALDDLASLVEDHHVAHGCRPIPTRTGDTAADPTENRPTPQGVRLGSRVLHAIAGRNTTGNALTVCGRTIDRADPRYREEAPEDVPIDRHCLSCWS